MERHCFIILLIIMVSLDYSLSKEESGNFLRELFNTVVHDISCGDVVQCDIAPAFSYGCHLYSNERARNAESCLVRTYSGKTPVLYVKPEEDFEYLEVIMFHRLCTESAVLGVGNLGILGEWKLTADYFHRHNDWHEVKLRLNSATRRYQLILDGIQEVGAPQKIRSLNKTHIQIMVRGSAHWSFDCDQSKTLEVSQDFPLLPWILFFILALLLVVILVCIIIYCLKKLNKQTRGLNDCNSFKISSRSTISLISSPMPLQSQSYDPRGSTDFAGATSSCDTNNVGGVQKWSYQQWSQNPSGGTHFGFEKYSNRNSLAEHEYEDPDQPNETIYSEITDFNLPSSTKAKKPIIPFNRGNSTGSSFSTVNSLYGYR